jgi:hypothetical protein
MNDHVLTLGMLDLMNYGFLEINYICSLIKPYTKNGQ